mgnify:FL=1
MPKNKSKGITLIALVITIIILLILAGISISALTNQGLFRNAKVAQNATEKAEAEQGQRLNEYEDEINKYLSNNDKKEEKLVDKVNDGTIKIGDYVKYTPDTASTTEILQELNTYSGSNANTASTLTQESLNWRVLDVKDGQARLISELPTTSKLTLYGYNGYNNAVKLLDDTCVTLYSNSKLASKVQNLKIEDIQEKMIETNYANIDTNYGKTFTPSSKYYSSIYAREKNQKVNGTNGTDLNFSEQTELINQTTEIQASSLEAKYTYWKKTLEKSDFKNGNYYNILLENQSNYLSYWISSRCTYSNLGCIGFGVRVIDSDILADRSLYNSANVQKSADFSFRPVVTLNSNIKIDTVNSGNGSTSEQAYVIK